MSMLWQRFRYAFWINFHKPHIKLRMIQREGVLLRPARSTEVRREYIQPRHSSLKSGLFLSTAQKYRSFTLISSRIKSAPVPTTFPTIRIFHTTARRRVHPVLWAVLKPVGKVGAMLWGRYVRKWWAKIPLDKRIQYKELFGGMKGIILSLVGALLVAGVVNYIIHLQTNPMTGRTRFISLSQDQIMTIAEFEEEGYLTQYKDKLIPKNNPIWKSVNHCARRLLDSNMEECATFKSLQWTVSVIDDDETNNAFVLPNGHIFVFTGMIKNMKNIDQLAIILGHEIAHAVMGHAIEHISRGQILDFAMIAILAAIWTFVPGDGIAIVTQWFYQKLNNLMLELPYSRELESEADKVGLMFAARACYDVREAIALWALTHARLQYSDDVKVPEFLSTHPTHESRVEKLRQYLPDFGLLETNMHRAKILSRGGTSASNSALAVRSQCPCKKLDPTCDPEVRVKGEIETLKLQYESKTAIRLKPTVS